MSKNKSNNNSHASANNQTNNSTCPYCSSRVIKPNFKTVFYFDEDGNTLPCPDSTYYICEKCNESFLYINGKLESCASGFIDVPINDREEAEKSNKIGRNEKCTCGSGLKYKNCCGKNYQPLATQQMSADFLMKQ
jgi:hypothetical protein